MSTETFELYALTAKLTLDTAQFDRAYNDSRGKMKTLAGEVNKLEAATKSGAGGVSGLGGALKSLMPSLSGLGGPAGAIGIVTVGLGLYAAAMEKASTGVWELTKRFSDIGSELQDMADQVNFSTETLGTFQGVGKSVGVEVEQLSTGLVTFQKNVIGGNDALKALGVTSKDNETALRETFKALSMVTDKTLQSALAQEIFGKSGKVMLALVKATGGEFEAAQEKLRKWNVLMSDQSVAIADEFGDKLGELGLRFQGIGNTIATETAPAFIAALDQISAALDAGVLDWKWWGEQVGNIIVSSTAIIAGFIKAVQSMDYNFNPGAFIMVWKEGMDQAIAEMNAKRGELLQPMPEGMGGGRVPGPTIDWNPNGNKKKKTGKSETEREAEREQRELERIMEQRGDMIERMNMEYKRLSDELKGVDVNTRSYAVAESQLIGILKGASPELIKQAEAIAKSTDNREKQLGLQNQLLAFMTAQDEAVKRAIEGERSHTQATEERIKTWQRQGAVLKDTTIEWLRYAAVMQDVFANIANMPQNIDKATKAFPLPQIIFPTQTEDETTRGAGETANREAGLPPEMKLDPMVKWRRMIEDFSFDITDTLDNAITEGFEGGLDNGLAAFGRTLLRMAKHEALDMLRKAIFDALNPDMGAGEAGGGGGGESGWLKMAIKFGISAIAGLFAGGGGGGGDVMGAGGAMGIGMKATGGYQPPNSWYWRGESGPELARSGPSGDQVMSNQQSMAFAGGGITFNVFAKDAASFGAPATQAQISRRLRRLAALR